MSHATPPPPRTVRYDDAWNNSLLRPLLITLLVVCLDVAIVEIIRLVAPDLPPAFLRLLLGVGMGSALVGSYTSTILAQAQNRSRRTFSYRLAEIGLILLGMRLILWAVMDSWPSRDAMLYEPLETLITWDYFTAALIAFASWTFANLFTGDFNLMALQPDELLELQSGSGERPGAAAYLRGSRADRAEYIDRLAIVQRFAGRWIFGAVLLMIMTALARFGGPQSGLLALTRQNIDPRIMAAAVVYLLTGLILISQGQLAALRARWALENILDVQSVLRRWPLYAILLILGMGAIAALLPFGGTFRLAQILGFFLYLLQQFINAVLVLFALLLALLSGKEVEEPPQSTPEPAPPMSMPDLLPPMTDPLIEPWMGGLLFWIITGLLLGYAALIYLQGKGLRLDWIGLLWQWLCQMWADVWRSLRGWQRQVAVALARARLELGQAGSGQPSRLRRLLGQMSPEEKVRYYYLDTLARAEEVGLPRKASETPAHYAPRLQADLAQRAAPPPDLTTDPPAPVSPPVPAPAPSPEAETGPVAAVEDLTAAFEEVKYGAKPVTAGQVSHIQRLWELVKARL